MAEELLPESLIVPTSVTNLSACSALSSGLNAEQLQLIAEISSDAKFRAGQHLWRQGEFHETCYLVISGQLALEIYVPMHGPIAVDKIGPGELLGGSGLLNRQKWNFDARALTDVQAVAVDCSQLARLIEDDHELGYHVYRCLARILDGRLSTARRRLLEMAVPVRA